MSMCNIWKGNDLKEYNAQSKSVITRGACASESPDPDETINVDQLMLPCRAINHIESFFAFFNLMKVMAILSAYFVPTILPL